MENAVEDQAAAAQNVRIANNSAILFLAFGSNMLLGFAGNYISAKYLGLEDFGRLSLVLVVAGAVGLARTGVATTVMKLSATRVLDDLTLIRAGILLQVGIGTSFAFLVVPSILVIDGSSRLVVPCLLVAGAVVVQSIYEMPTAMFAGKDRMLWQLTTTAMLALTVAIGSFMFASVSNGLVAWPSAMFAAALVVASAVMLRLGKPLRLHTIPPGTLASMLPSAAALCGIAFLLQIHWSVEIVVVRLMATPAELGLFSAGTRLLPAFRTVAVVLTTATAPTLFRVIDTPGALRRLMNTSLRQMGIIGCVLTLLVFGSAEAITHLMFPPQFSDAATILRIVSLSVTPLLLQWVFLNFLWVRGRWWTLTGCYLAATTIQALSGYYAVPVFGAIGAAWVLVIIECSLAVAMVMVTQSQIKNLTTEGASAAAMSVGIAAGIAIVGWHTRTEQFTSLVAIAGLLIAARATGVLRDVDLVPLRQLASNWSRAIFRNSSHRTSIR